MKVSLIDSMGNDLTVVNAARVSFDKESKEFSEQDEKLIWYLAKHKHLSPFGHCFTTFRVRAPVFVSRQLVKHKFLRINEVSRRYVDSTPEFYDPIFWRKKAEDKKQGSSKEGTMLPGDSLDIYQEVLEHSLATYQEMIDLGVAPEMARMVLPQSMMTEWYWSGSMDAFAAMCNLRCKPDAQEETRIIAELIDFEMSKLYPVSWEALRAYGDD